MTILICDEATAVPNSKDILFSEADRTAYHEETIAESHDTLQSELEEVYKKNRERDQRELDLSKRPKVLVAVDIRSKNCFQRLVMRVVVPFL